MHSTHSTGWPLFITSVSPVHRLPRSWSTHTEHLSEWSSLGMVRLYSLKERCMQGDPLAMAMYALAITHLIHKLRSSCPCVQQVCLPTMPQVPLYLFKSQQKLSWCGPAFGYYPNASKTYLVIKEEHETQARQLFADTDVHITIQGKRHLGAAIGSRMNEFSARCRLRLTRSKD